MPGKRKTRDAVRSAITGRFVRKGRAKSNPRTTITQRIKIGSRGKKK
jgi:hypothetical protein